MHEDQVHQLVEREYGRLLRAVTLYCGSVEVAEDAVQDALAKALDRSSVPDDPDSAALWVTTVAFNRARRTFRRRRTELTARERLGSSGEAGPPAASAEAIDVRRAVLCLPHRQREVVVLFYFLGHSVVAVSQSLAISETATRNALHKARTNLARTLGPDYRTGGVDVRR